MLLTAIHIFSGLLIILFVQEVGHLCAALMVGRYPKLFSLYYSLVMVLRDYGFSRIPLSYLVKDSSERSWRMPLIHSESSFLRTIGVLLAFPFLLTGTLFESLFPPPDGLEEIEEPFTHMHPIAEIFVCLGGPILGFLYGCLALTIVFVQGFGMTVIEGAQTVIFFIAYMLGAFLEVLIHGHPIPQHGLVEPMVDQIQNGNRLGTSFGAWMYYTGAYSLILSMFKLLPIPPMEGANVSLALTRWIFGSRTYYQVRDWMYFSFICVSGWVVVYFVALDVRWIVSMMFS
jgi:hypothetical protein